MSAEPLWRLNDVQLRHGRAAWPAEPWNLQIPRGRIAVLGSSGAGKTSLLNVLAGFARPLRGTVTSPGELAWVPQSHGLWLEHTGLEHLTLVGASRAEALELLRAFDLATRADERASVLSLGEGARLAVCRALAQGAKAIVMDEPLAHVDAARQGRYWQVIRERVEASGGSFIFSSHQTELALAEADHAVCMADGRIVYHGPMNALYEEPSSLELAEFLGRTNWLTPEDAALWLDAQWSAPRSARPERVALTPSESGCAVVASRFHGSLAETELRHPSGATRAFLHRPASGLPIGSVVRVELLPRA